MCDWRVVPGKADPWHQCINVRMSASVQSTYLASSTASCHYGSVKSINMHLQLFVVSRLSNTAFIFSLCQGYEHILGNPQRPITLGLQAAGWKGLQHAPHRVKGKKHCRPLVHLPASLTSLLRGHQYIIDVNLQLSSSVAVLLFCTAAATVGVAAHFQAMLNLFTLLVRSQPLNRINFQKFYKLMSLLKRVVSALQAL